MAVNEYEVILSNGLRVTMMLEADEAKEHGAQPVSGVTVDSEPAEVAEKAEPVKPANKARRVAVKDANG